MSDNKLKSTWYPVYEEPEVYFASRQAKKYFIKEAVKYYKSLENMNQLKCVGGMDSKEYRKSLNSKEWKMCRERILERDCHKCCKCGKTENLDVHHKYYVSSAKPWEYEDNALVTLCRDCHIISEFNCKFIYDEKR